MKQLIALVKGRRGHPSHPPLTDVSIGAYTVGVVMLILGAFEVEEEQMAHGALLAISAGLIIAIPTAFTGFLDWLTLKKGSPTWKIATIHMGIMLVATIIFLITWFAQLNGYKHDDIKTLALVLGIIGELILVIGGYVGGTIVFVHGCRVENQPDLSVKESLISVPHKQERPEQPFE